MRISGIYKIECLKNGLVRIGESKDIIKRLSYYRATLRGGYFNNQAMQGDFNTYGENNFSFDVLEMCPIDQLKKREEFYLNKYKDRCKYNKNKVRSYKKFKRIGEEAEEYYLYRSSVTSGEKNGNASLTQKEASEIKWLCKHSDLKLKQIAELYNTTLNIVSKISSGIRWCDIPAIKPIN